MFVGAIAPRDITNHFTDRDCIEQGTIHVVHSIEAMLMHFQIKALASQNDSINFCIPTKQSLHCCLSILGFGNRLDKETNS